jgi:activator of HSP90 ATPase
MSWKGKTAQGDEVTGKLTVPEVSHEMIDGHSEYSVSTGFITFVHPTRGGLALINIPSSSRQYEFSLIDNDAYRTFLRSAFPSALAGKFNLFPKALVDTHGGPSAVSPSESGVATPDATEPQSTGTPTIAVEKKVEEKKSVVGGLSSVEVESRLAASADDMWLFLTDEKRVPAWTRAPAKVSIRTNEESVTRLVS